MYLPTELLTIVLLTSSAFAIPQIAPAANETAQSTDSIKTPQPTFPPDEGLQDPQEDPPLNDPCSTESCWPLNFIPSLPTETGWGDDINVIAAPSAIVIIDEPPTLVTTRTPTIIGIQTAIVPVLSPSRSAKPDGGRIVVVGPSGNGNNEPSAALALTPAPAPSPAPGQQPGPKGDNAQATPSVDAQPSVNNDLLLDIISKMGETPPPAELTHVSDTAAGTTEEHDPEQHQAMTNVVDTAHEQVTLSVGASITVGSAVVTLTPGLSTTIGDGTMIGITTDNTGQTIITIASSGTAVTATVSNAPVTMTVPKPGFEASITAAARPGAASASSARERVASSSSKAGAMAHAVEFDWVTRAVLGILGIGVIL
ncbi:hypothetical protein ACN47E_000423 [Coniothyrium glycines]